MQFETGEYKEAGNMCSIFLCMHNENHFVEFFNAFQLSSAPLSDVHLNQTT